MRCNKCLDIKKTRDTTNPARGYKCKDCGWCFCEMDTNNLDHIAFAKKRGGLDE